MSNILMLLSNPFRPDPRVAREARSLVEWGHHVIIVCWDRQAEYPERESLDGIKIIRVQSVRSAYGSGPRQLFYLPRFWLEAIHLATETSPDVVHCHDLDTLYAGRRIKKQTGCHLVYDAHEDYPALMSLYLPGLMVRVLAWWERGMIRSVDHTITASSMLADKLADAGIHQVTTIGNYQPLETFDISSEVERVQSREKLGIKESNLFIIYIGGFSRNRLLLPLIRAVQGIPQVQVILWGDGHQRQSVEEAIKAVPEVRYCGWLPAEQVPRMMAAGDVIYYCLNPDYPGAIYNAPNTLSYAMAAGRPILANAVGDLGRIVRETGCGILLEQVTPQTIRKAIETLRDPSLRSMLGQAGRIAAEGRYNWNMAKHLLSQVYKGLLDKGT